MQLQAFAKINLDLRILGRRDDGYHELRTVFQTIDWSDEIRIESANQFTFTEHGVTAGEENLVDAIIGKPFAFDQVSAVLAKVCTSDAVVEEAELVAQ